MVLVVIACGGCAYKLSTKAEKLPGDLKTIQIPLFKNVSTEPGTEIFFTNALKNETLISGCEARE